MAKVTFDTAEAALAALNTKLDTNREALADAEAALVTEAATLDSQIALLRAAEAEAKQARLAAEQNKENVLREKQLQISNLRAQNTAIKDEYGPLHEAVGVIKKVRDDAEALDAASLAREQAATAKEAQLAAKEAELIEREGKLPPVEPEPDQPIEP